MPSTFPAGTDVFPDDATLEGHTFDDIDGAGTDHTTWMGDVGDAVEAIQNNVLRIGGITNASQPNVGDARVFGSAPFYAMRRANGTEQSPSAVLNNETIGTIGWGGHGTTGFPAFGLHAAISTTAAENFTDSSTGTRLIFSTTQRGAVIPTEKMRLDDAGHLYLGGGTFSNAWLGIGDALTAPGMPTPAGTGVSVKRNSPVGDVPGHGLQALIKLGNGTVDSNCIGVTGRVELNDDDSSGYTRDIVGVWGDCIVNADSGRSVWGSHFKVNIEPGVNYARAATGCEIAYRNKGTLHNAGGILHLTAGQSTAGLNFGVLINSDEVEPARINVNLLMDSESNAGPRHSAIWYGPMTAAAPSGTPLFRVVGQEMALPGGSIITSGLVEMNQLSSSPAAPVNGVRIYAEKDGGKTRLMAVFPSGPAQQLAIEP